MTFSETAAALRKLADGLEKVLEKHDGKDREIGSPTPLLEGDASVGAAAFLCYLRDLFTGTPKEAWTRDELLVLFETMSRDPEIFPCGIGQLVWQLDDEDEDSKT